MKKNIKSSLLSVCAMTMLSSAWAAPQMHNLVTKQMSAVNKIIGDKDHKFHILTQKNSAKGVGKNAESLIVGIPSGLFREQMIFGGVITKVSDKTNETLGSLKLTDLSPLHVKLHYVDQAKTIVINGCASNCDEESAQQALIMLEGAAELNGMVYVDLAEIGKSLNLISMMDSEGEYTKLKALSSETVSFDYSVSTLVFDIKSKFIPLDREITDATAPVTEFTVRWYLKLNSGSNPAFAPRAATEGVGFFKTERSKNPKITRFSTTNYRDTSYGIENKNEGVTYYIKNVPEKYQHLFVGAINNWNTEFKAVLGRNLLNAEIVRPEDNDKYNTGDIRYNIIEWDLDNIASYGGLGPSIANQMTGETISANVLIQGPTIISLYTKWFELSKTARGLIAEGKRAEANSIVAKFNREAKAEIANRQKLKFGLKLGNVEMTVQSQRIDLEDPMIKNHFEIVPAGVSFEDYMSGYFTEMLEHELGHNLGLRHNFKGNLGAYESEDKGSVSRSIMEYLGRPYRYKSAIGLYDKMAISYGYKGIAPKHLNWFCTDEDQGSDKMSLAVKSAECTKSDATSDPFSFWEQRLARAIDLLIDTKSSSAPVWTSAEVKTQIDEAVLGMGAYAASAEKTMATWTNFFGKGNRPEDVEGIKGYVLGAIKKKVCDPELKAIINAKETPEAVKLAQENLDALKKAVAAKAVELAVFSAEQVQCE